MDNEQFRNLLLKSSSNGAPAARQSAGGSDVPSALGSRKSGFMSMKPRNVKGTSAGQHFARQVAENNKTSGSTKNASSSGPRGVKLAKGYQDRALGRLNAETDEADEKEVQIKALEERYKEGKLERDEFERLRDELAGGEVESTHLIKGLDRKLLERVRRGEDVLNGGADAGAGDGEASDEDEQFDDLERKEVEIKAKERAAKRGELAAPAPIAGVKRSRDDILKELKAKRQAEQEAKQASRPELDSRFKSIQSRTDKPKVQLDSKGREVIVTRDEHGRLKKKVRKVETPANTTQTAAPIKFLDEGAAVAPAVKPAAVLEEVESEPEAMFDDVGDDYDPLGGLDSGDDDDDEEDSSESDGEDEGEVKDAHVSRSPQPVTKNHPREDATAPPIQARNYFSASRDRDAEQSEPAADANPFKDPAFLSAISRAGNLAKFKMQLGGDDTGEGNATRQADNDNDDGDHQDGEEEESRLERMNEEARLRKKREMLLKDSTRDLDDMDLGFGGGRFDDDDDNADDGKVKLSEWKAGGRHDDDGDDGGRGQRGGGGKKKRSRGKRKGDKNDAKDVMEVLKRRQG